MIRTFARVAAFAFGVPRDVLRRADAEAEAKAYAAEAFADVEAAEEVWEAPLSADHDDEQPCPHPNYYMHVGPEGNPTARCTLCHVEGVPTSYVRLWGCNRCDGPLLPSYELRDGLCPSCYEYYFPQDSRSQRNDAVEERLGREQTPTLPSEAPLTWEGWAVPAIQEVLAEHWFRYASHDSIGWQAHCGCGHRPLDQQDWRDHVSPIITARIACDPVRAAAALATYRTQK
jgi:hypothetical protein